MTENAKKWLELISGDPTLKEAMRSLKGRPPEEIRQVEKETAKAYGIFLTDADYEVPESREITEEELSAITGGGGCGCFAIGGGGGTDSQDGDTYGCACFALGGGGDGTNTTCNCVCYSAGGGTDEGC